MIDSNVLIALLLITGVIVVCTLYVLRDRLRRLSTKISKKGVEIHAEAESGSQQPSKGVDLSGSEFGDDNTFSATSDSAIKAQKLKAGSGNQFTFGSNKKSDKK